MAAAVAVVLVVVVVAMATPVEDMVVVLVAMLGLLVVVLLPVLLPMLAETCSVHPNVEKRLALFGRRTKHRALLAALFANFKGRSAELCCPSSG